MLTWPSTHCNRDLSKFCYCKIKVLTVKLTECPYQLGRYFHPTVHQFNILDFINDDEEIINLIVHSNTFIIFFFCSFKKVAVFETCCLQ